MNKHCKIILETFKFLETIGFKCIIENPNGFISVRYDYGTKYLRMLTDYREEIDYFSITVLTGNEIQSHKIFLPEVKDIYDLNLGSLGDCEKLRALENTMDNFEEVIEVYAKFIKKNLEAIIKLLK